MGGVIRRGKPLEIGTPIVCWTRGANMHSFLFEPYGGFSAVEMLGVALVWKIYLHGRLSPEDKTMARENGLDPFAVELAFTLVNDIDLSKEVDEQGKTPREVMAEKVRIAREVVL